MKNLQLAEAVEQTIDYELVKMEIKRIQIDVMQNTSKQKRAFLFGNLKFILCSLVVYAGVVLIAWAKYRK